MKYSDGKFDKFYTKTDVAKSLLKLLELKSFDAIIEPSAGNGSFYNLLPKKKKIGIDLAPETKGIIKMDWFQYKISHSFKNVAIIGNPPFGKRNKLSINFIKHAASFKNVNLIAFILPDVFNKYTLQKYIPNEFKITEIKKLNNFSFESINGEVNIPSSFFVMERNGKRDLRQKIVLKSDDFEFVTKNDKFDIFIFGSAPHKKIEWSNKNSITKNNKGYYIKSKINIDEFISKYDSIKWKGYSSVNGGVYWLTKVDIIDNYVRWNPKNRK